jgi:hypothetical protein
VIGQRAEKLGYADKFAGRKKRQKTLSWLQLALNLLRESSEYLNLLVDNSANCFALHWV